jgi:hypothetical protein
VKFFRWRWLVLAGIFGSATALIAGVFREHLLRLGLQRAGARLEPTRFVVEREHGFSCAVVPIRTHTCTHTRKADRETSAASAQTQISF